MRLLRLSQSRFLGAVILALLFGVILGVVFAASNSVWASVSSGGVPSTTFNTITATVGAAPVAIGVNPVTGYTYLANKESASVSILQGTSVVTIVTPGGSPRSIGVNPATGYIYVGNYYSNDVSILHGTSVVTTVGEVAYPTVVAVNPSTGYVYVGGSYFNKVWIFSATQYITDVTFGVFGPSNHPYDIEANVLNGSVYVSTFNAGYQVKVLNGDQVIATIPVSSAGQIGINPVTGYVYLTNANNGTQPGSLTVISDTAVVGEIPAGTNPHAIAVDPLRGYVYVANNSDGTVTVITGTSVLTTVAVTAAPYAIGVDPTTGFAFVTGDLDTTVHVLKGPEVVGTTTSESGAHSLVSDPATGLTYIANEYSNSVSIIQRALSVRVYLPLIVGN